jgi:hypothetical protein
MTPRSLNPFNLSILAITSFAIAATIYRGGCDWSHDQWSANGSRWQLFKSHFHTNAALPHK